MRVDLVRRKFLHKALRLVQRKEFGDADANERRLLLYCGIVPAVSVSDAHLAEMEKIFTYGVLELRVDFRNHRPHRFQFGEHVFWRIGLTTHEARHLLRRIIGVSMDGQTSEFDISVKLCDGGMAYFNSIPPERIP